MNSVQSVLRNAVLTVVLLIASTLHASTLVYERQYSHFEHGQNTLRVMLTDQGLLTIERPQFMTQPGRYEYQVDPVHYLSLSSGLNAVPAGSVELQSRYRQRLEGQSLFVSHPELSRFQRLDASRNVMDQLEIESIDAQRLQTRDDPALEQAKRLEAQWWQLMDDALNNQSDSATEAQTRFSP